MPAVLGQVPLLKRLHASSVPALGDGGGRLYGLYLWPLIGWFCMLACFSLLRGVELSAKRAHAHCSVVWSGEWHSVQHSLSRSTVAAMIDEARSFHGKSTPAALCCLKSWSYASQPRPVCLRDCWITICAYAAMFRVCWQSVAATMYPKKQ